MSITVTRARRVEARTEIDLPLSAGALWARMRDYATFLTLDPLHARVRVVSRGASSPRGDALVISHRLLGIGPDRVGRILRWEEGRGYAVSDLSRRRGRVGFPHVCTYEVVPLPGGGCRLIIGARGLWTAPLPRWAARLWLWWVLRATEARLAVEMLGIAAPNHSCGGGSRSGTGVRPKRAAEGAAL